MGQFATEIKPARLALMRITAYGRTVIDSEMGDTFERMALQEIQCAVAKALREAQSGGRLLETSKADGDHHANQDLRHA